MTRGRRRHRRRFIRLPEGLRRGVSGGLADSALSSLSTFLIGAHAARYLSPQALGVYGLLMSGFIVAVMVPAELVITPLEVRLVAFANESQLASVPRSLRLGLGPAALASLTVTAVSLAFAAGADPAVSLTLAAGACVAAILSPLQDHVRRMLHQTGRSGQAALTAVVQLVVVVSVLGAVTASGLEPHVAPFSALALANVVSLMVGLRFAARAAGRAKAPSRRTGVFRLGRVTRVGGWLLWAGVADRLSNYALVALVWLVVSKEAVGQLEAARVLSQPMFVLATGLVVVLRPRVITAALGGERGQARRLRRAFAGSVLAIGLGYAALAGTQWPLNPLPRLFPVAFETSGLLALWIVAAAATYCLYTVPAELVSVGRQRSVARIATLAGLATVAAGFVLLAAGVGVRGVPLALLTRAAVSALGMALVVRAVYRRASRRAARLPNAVRG
ncbi:MAG: lipopolysaccharide biosynthesis protein [Acidimicrobiales bacterium]